MVLGRRVLFFEACKEAFKAGKLSKCAKRLLTSLQLYLNLPKAQATKLASQAKRSSAQKPTTSSKQLTGNRLFELACSIAWADKVLDKRELSILAGLAKMLGISEERAKGVLEKLAPLHAEPTVQMKAKSFKKRASLGGIGEKPCLKSIEKPIHYAESGNFSLSGVVLATVVSLLTAISIGFIIGYASGAAPSLESSLFLVIVHCLFLGTVVAKVANISKIRNRFVVLGLALVAALLSEYVAFATLGWARFSTASFSVSPSFVYESFALCLKNGAWSIEGTVVKGSPLLLIWTCELIFVVGACLYTSWKTYAKFAFCEECNSWASDEKTRYKMYAGDYSELRIELERGELSCFRQLKSCCSTENHHLEFQLTACNCKQGHFLTLVEKRKVVYENNREKWETSVLIQKLRISKEMHQGLLKLTY